MLTHSGLLVSALASAVTKGIRLETKFMHLNRRGRACPPAGIPLTTVNEKLDLFGFDPYFRDSCDDIRSLTDGGEEVDLWNTTFVIFRPDAVVTRSVLRGVDLLSRSGFSILSIQEVQYSYLSVRECWRYQHNINTRDRILAMDLLMTSTPSVLCLLSADCREDKLPASARLKVLKGSSMPDRRKPGQLRFEMGGVRSPMLTFVHAPDEPADVLRELAVFLAPASRMEAYRRFAGRANALSKEEVTSFVDDLYSRTPSHDLDATAVLKVLAQRGHVPTSLIVDIDRGVPRALGDVLRQLGQDPNFGPLDAVAIATRIDQGHLAGVTPVLPDADPLAWQHQK